MTLKVIGAGVGRTGTASLKLALERLLGGPCHHMENVINDQQQTRRWLDVCSNPKPDWSAIFSGCVATVDAPSAYFWRELSVVYPDALVILSTRDSESWWQSASKTIFTTIGDTNISSEWKQMITTLPNRIFRPDMLRDEAIAAFEKHNADVKSSIPKERLLIWSADDGWEPLCKALNVPVPKEPFPCVNLRKDWKLRKYAGSKWFGGFFRMFMTNR